MARRRSKLDYFPFFPKDCEADEAIRMMDDAQFGFWMRCLCLQWPNGSIPADPSALAMVLSGHEPGRRGRSVEYVAGMLGGVVGLRFTPLPANEGSNTIPTNGGSDLLVQDSNNERVPPNGGRLADRRLLEEKAIAEAESARNRTNAENKDPDNTTFAERKKETSRSDPLFCSVLSIDKSNEVDSWFESDIWAVYPKKVSKPHALKAARAHGKTAADREAISAGLKRAIPGLRKQHAEGFCPNLATWLNGERWNDEAGATAAAPVSSAQKPWKPDW